MMIGPAAGGANPMFVGMTGSGGSMKGFGGGGGGGLFRGSITCRGSMAVFLGSDAAFLGSA